MIPAELSAEYARIRPDLDVLQGRVDSILGDLAESRSGEYMSRIKTVESIFEKLVRGEFSSLHAMNDLLGTTLVLPTLPTEADRADIELSLDERFEIVETLSNRTKRPSEFVYDDLHYILKIKDSALLVDKTLLRWIFELQVKSFLQHGWAKTTHNVAYKASKETWSLARVAAQTKAMVEVADIALSRPDDFLPPGQGLPNIAIDVRRKINDALEAWWNGALPDNRRRLAVFVSDLMAAAKLDIDELEALLESTRGQELRTSYSLSVQQSVLILFLEQDSEALLKGLRKRSRLLLISSEMDDLSDACRSVPGEMRVELGHPS